MPRRIVIAMPGGGAITAQDLAPAVKEIASGSWQKALPLIANVIGTAFASPIVGALGFGGVQFFSEMVATSADRRVKEEAARLDTQQELVDLLTGHLLGAMESLQRGHVDELRLLAGDLSVDDGEQFERLARTLGDVHQKLDAQATTLGRMEAGRSEDSALLQQILAQVSSQKGASPSSNAQNELHEVQALRVLTSIRKLIRGAEDLAKSTCMHLSSSVKSLEVFAEQQADLSRMHRQYRFGRRNLLYIVGESRAVLPELSGALGEALELGSQFEDWGEPVSVAESSLEVQYADFHQLWKIRGRALERRLPLIRSTARMGEELYREWALERGLNDARALQLGSGMLDDYFASLSALGEHCHRLAAISSSDGNPLHACAWRMAPLIDDMNRTFWVIEEEGLALQGRLGVGDEQQRELREALTSVVELQYRIGRTFAGLLESLVPLAQLPGGRAGDEVIGRVVQQQPAWGVLGDLFLQGRDSVRL